MFAPCRVIVPDAVNPWSRYTSWPTRIPEPNSEWPVVPSAVRTASCAPLQTRSPPMSAPCKVIVPVAVNPWSRYTSRPTRIPAPTSDWPILLAPNWARLQTNWPPISAPSSHRAPGRGQPPQEHVAADLQPVGHQCITITVSASQVSGITDQLPFDIGKHENNRPGSGDLVQQHPPADSHPGGSQRIAVGAAHGKLRAAADEISADVRASQGDCSRGREPVVEVYVTADAHPRAD